MPRPVFLVASSSTSGAGVVGPIPSTSQQNDPRLQPTTPPILTRPRQASRRPTTFTTLPYRQLKTDIAVSPPPQATDAPPRAAVNAAPVAAATPAPVPADILPALASLASILHIPSAVAVAPQAIASVSSLLAAPLSIIPAVPAESSTLLVGHSSSAFSTSTSARPSATSTAHLATPDAGHSSIMAVLVVGGVVATLFGSLAAWHSFRKSRKTRGSHITPVFGGLTPPNFRPSEEKFIGRPWQTFEDKEGLPVSTSAANDLAHLQYLPTGTALPPAKSTLAPVGLLTPSGFSMLSALSPAKLRVRNGDISKPRVGLGYETHSIHVPTKPAPKPPTPPIPSPPPNMPLPQLPTQPASVFVMVTSASQGSLAIRQAAASTAAHSTTKAFTPRDPPQSGLMRQHSAKTPAMTPNERPLTELQTKVLTSALGLTSPPSPNIDLDLYRYTRYGFEDAQSEYPPSPPLRSTVLPPDASPNTALGQLLLDSAPSPYPSPQPTAPQMLQSKSSSERSLVLPPSYTHSSSSPGLPYLSSADDGVWPEEESRLAPLPVKPLKVARKDTRGPSKKHRVKRASLLPRLEFPMPPATVPARPSLWDEAAAM